MTPYPWGQWETPYHIFWGQWVTPYPGGQWVIPYPLGQWVPPCILTASGDPPHPRSPVPYGAVCPPPPPALDEGRRFSHSRWLQAGAQRAARGLSVPPPTWGDRFVREQHGAERPPPPNETPPHPTSPSLSPQSAPRPEDPPNGTLQPSAVS